MVTLEEKRIFCESLGIAVEQVRVAKTKKGKPCSNVPQKGESYCGPHLDQLKK